MRLVAWSWVSEFGEFWCIQMDHFRYWESITSSFKKICRFSLYSKVSSLKMELLAIF